MGSMEKKRCSRGNGEEAEHHGPEARDRAPAEGAAGAHERQAQFHELVECIRLGFGRPEEAADVVLAMYTILESMTKFLLHRDEGAAAGASASAAALRHPGAAGVAAAAGGAAAGSATPAATAAAGANISPTAQALHATRLSTLLRLVAERDKDLGVKNAQLEAARREARTLKRQVRDLQKKADEEQAAQKQQAAKHEQAVAAKDATIENLRTMLLQEREAAATAAKAELRRSARARKKGEKAAQHARVLASREARAQAASEVAERRLQQARLAKGVNERGPVPSGRQDDSSGSD